MKRLDPISLEILWRRLISIVDEADAAVAQPAEPSGLGSAFEPGPADVAEHRGAQPEEAEELARAIPALLDRQQGAPVTLLVAQRIAAQAGVATEEELVLGVEVARQVEAAGDVERRRERLGLPFSLGVAEPSLAQPASVGKSVDGDRHAGRIGPPPLRVNDTGGIDWLEKRARQDSSLRPPA